MNEKCLENATEYRSMSETFETYKMTQKKSKQG